LLTEWFIMLAGPFYFRSYNLEGVKL